MTQKSASSSLTTDFPSLPQTSLTAIPHIVKDPLAFFLATREIYGDIYTLNLGVTKLIVFNHPRHAQHILQQHASNYPKGGALWESLGTLLGNGLPASEGELWLRQRRMMQPHFHRKRLEALADLMVEAIDEAMIDWNTAVGSSSPFKINVAFSHMTMRVIVKTMFGTGLSHEEVEKVSDALAYAMDFMIRGMITNYFPKWLPVPGRNRYQQAVQTIDNIVLSIIQRLRESDADADDLITMLIRMTDDETGEKMSDQQLRDEAVSIFLAGYETTAVTLTWITHFLLSNPLAMNRLKAEVDTALGDRPPTFADLPQLTYAHMLIQESLRLYPPVWWMLRVAREDDEIDGYPIPAGSMVAPMTYVIHHHPEFWSHPDRFDPERFLPERIAQQHKFAWIPFGAGHRLCIGREFAQMEGQLVLARMLQRFKMTPVGLTEAKLHAAVAIRSKEAIHVRLENR